MRSLGFGVNLGAPLRVSFDRGAIIGDLWCKSLIV